MVVHPRAVTIYGLRDETGLRYVGKTYKPLGERLAEHLKEARAGRRTHRLNWLRVKEHEVQPFAIATVPTMRANDAERFWVAFARTCGYDLVNETEGGDGVVGPSAASVERMASKLRGRKMPPLSEEARARMSFARMGLPSHKWTDAEKQRMSAIMKRRTFSPEHRARISKARLGHETTLATRAKIAATLQSLHTQPPSRKGVPVTAVAKARALVTWRERYGFHHPRLTKRHFVGWT